ncbi:AI-2E family transporter [Sphingomonas sp. CL5.1]|uniref:AI-2E family transporter n=1 Tax=Sphingomonas sp. CL5.1 TaxID=2653203 RepID=UPI00159844E5|nr:AI-2E family transporter [Sphingomonas sp. CL5.1]QKR98766.1 AI-2E family transporter [Sphingomonas sp. CL5.1]
MSASRVEVVAGASPHEVRNPETRREIRRAAVWLGMASAIALVVLLIQPLLIIFAGLVFAALLDGGVRLLGRVLPIARGLRLLIVCLLTIAFLVATFYIAGVQIADQVTQLRSTVEVQGMRFASWLSAQGLVPGANDVSSMAREALSSVGRLTSWVGTAFGALTTMFMIMVIGLFVAMDPKVYDRGLQWMVPEDNRREFAITVQEMGKTMRRLLAGRLVGMAAEGVFVGVALAIAGVPMALILGILTGMLAFIPNIGAFISGALTIAVGFSAGLHTGFAAIGIYVAVQLFDGYVIIPMVAKRAVDLPPALTLSAQILASALFGILGLALADPMTVLIKTAMERRSEHVEDEDAAAMDTP